VKASAAALAVMLVLVSSSPALAWDPLQEPTAAEWPVPTPAMDAAPYVAPPPGLYYVTDTYVADVVTTTGPLTTYATSTVHESTGSWARVLETVATGGLSIHDGSAFNGRRTLTDGRPVAGTYYENYVQTFSGFVPVSVVFFQDDAELARLAIETRQSQQSSASEMTSIQTPEEPTSIPIPVGSPIASAPCCGISRRAEASTLPRPTPSIRPLRPVLSLLPASGPLTRIEVLRGRPVMLWLRAFVDEREVPVRAWSVESGNVGDVVAASGSGTVPFRTAWRTLAPAGSAYEIVFRVEVDTPETGHRTAHSTIGVTVRSPALEE
jgi:hypothetical protein